MFEKLLVDNVWLAIAVWAIVYVSDYYATIYTARLYQTGGRKYFIYEGSFELTPRFQEDVDRLRLLSPRFLRATLLSCGAILIVWLATRWAELPQLFSFFVGALILREAAVHMRHFRNIALFRLARNPEGLRGRIEYTRRLVLKQSAAELFAFAMLFSLMFLISSSLFFLGGTLSCVITGRQHWAMANKARPALQQS